VQWSGNRGRTYFYQSELPYDVTQAYGDAGYVGYRVNNTVEAHTAVGTGVYHFFRDYAVTVQRGIAAPDWLADSFESPLSVYLTGRGRVLHVLNDRGSPTHDGRQAEWSCDKGPAVPYAPVPTTRIPESKVATTAPPATRTDIAVVLAALPDEHKATPDRSAESDRTEGASASARDSKATTDAEQAMDVTVGAGKARPLVPWWVYLMGLQSILLIGFGFYVARLRGQTRGLPSSPAAHGRGNTLVRSQVQEGSKALPGFNSLRLTAQSPVRLRGLAALTRTFSLSHAPSPATARSDTARSVMASPATSAFGARSPHWRPDEEE